MTNKKIILYSEKYDQLLEVEPIQGSTDGDTIMTLDADTEAKMRDLGYPTFDADNLIFLGFL